MAQNWHYYKKKFIKLSDTYVIFFKMYKCYVDIKNLETAGIQDGSRCLSADINEISNLLITVLLSRNLVNRFFDVANCGVLAQQLYWHYV